MTVTTPCTCVPAGRPRRALRTAVASKARVAAAIAVVVAAVGVGAAVDMRPTVAAGGEFMDAVTFGGIAFDAGLGIAVDDAGHVYTIGTFSGTVDFDPGPGTDIRTSNGARGVFITKTNATGSHEWAGTFDGFNGIRIAIDGAGNVFATGSFAGTADLDPGPGTDIRTSNGFGDVYVTKLDTNGAHQWTATFGGTGIEQGDSIAVDAAGNVYATGQFSSTVDFDPGAGIDSRTSNGGADVFITKLDTNGAHQWTATFGGTDFDIGFGAAVDAAGNVYATGQFSSTVDFDPGAGIDSRTSNGGADVFITKLDTNGAHQWTATFGGTDFDSSRDIAVDEAGNVHAVGRFTGTIDFDPGPDTAIRTSNGLTDVFITKLDTNGGHQWTTSFGGADIIGGFGIAVDAASHVYATGSFDGTVDFDPGPGTDNRATSGPFDYDVFITAFDANGGHQWATSVGGTEYDEGQGIAVDGRGNVYTTGSFSGTVDFDPGPGADARTSNGDDDVFILRLAAGTCNGLPVTVDIAAGDTPTAGPDVILGTANADVINGLGGDDTICGLGGDDTINAGPGADRVLAGDGDDTVFGSGGADTIDGGDGADTIQGNAGDDVISGGAGGDTLSGNEDDDTINGDTGDDTIYGVSGVDTINGGTGNDTILGGLGNDIIDGGGDDDLISGNAGDDTINGGDGADTIYGVTGADDLDGAVGADIILGGTGDDTIDGGGGADQLSGNEDADTINGGGGDDQIYGVDGDDVLTGGTGLDTILGGNDNDQIDGGDDNDLLSGNAGEDVVNGGGGDDEVYGANGNDTLTGGTGADVILGGNNNDTIDSADDEADQVSGNAGTDTCTRDPALDAVFACEVLLP